MGLFDGSNTAARMMYIAQAAAEEEARAQAAAEAEKQRQLALQAEAKRKQDVLAGNAAIDSAFSGFNDAYYQKAADKYSGYYAPQLKEQYDDALGKVTASLAGRGLLGSSVGADTLAKLKQRNADETTRVANEGLDFANQLRSKVAGDKNALYAASASAADPNSISAQAGANATAVSAFGARAPSAELGDVFGAFLSPLAQAASAAQNAPTATNKRVLNFASLGRGSGSGSVVR